MKFAVADDPHLQTFADRKTWIGCEVLDQKFVAVMQLQGNWQDFGVDWKMGPGTGLGSAWGTVKGLGSGLGPR